MIRTDALPAGTGRRRRGLQESEHRALLLAGDLVVAALAVLISLALWTITAGVDLSGALATRASWFLAAPAWAFGLAPSRRARIALSVGPTVRAIARLGGTLLVAYLAVYFYAPREKLPRLLALYFAWEACLLTLAWRLLYVWVFTATGFRRRVLVAGAGTAGEAIVKAFGDVTARDAEIVGFVDPDPARHGAVVCGRPVLGGYDLLPALAMREHVSQIILADGGRRAPLNVPHLLACQEAGIDMVPMAAAYERRLMRVPVGHVDPDWLFTSYAEAVNAKDASRIAKRIADILGGAIGTLLCVAAAPFIALAIWLDSGRPIFYRQVRVGFGGRPFVMTKFRTMVPHAESGGQPQWAGTDDPRVTRAGRWLRRARLDELPNFVSVLRGDMSLVGPRPERPAFVAALEREVPLYRARLVARPGLTGWAQINCPYGGSVADAAVKLEYDLYYLKHRSFLFDAWIILRTIGTVVTLRGR